MSDRSRKASTTSPSTATTRIVDSARARERLEEKLRSSIRTGRVKLSSGKETDFYFDGRLVTLDPEGAVLVAHLMLDEILARGARVVGGPTSGADPITSAIGVLAWQRGEPLHLYFVRKEKKGHGMQRGVEGPPIPAGSTVAMVDDVLTTGGSLLRARDTFEEETAIAPALALVIVDREEGGRENLAEAGLETVSLFRKADFL